MSSIDWPNLMRTGFQVLRLTPDAFWDLTPAEFRLMLGEGSKTGPLLSEGLDRLMEAYPDDPDKLRGYDDDR